MTLSETLRLDLPRCNHAIEALSADGTLRTRPHDLPRALTHFYAPPPLEKDSIPLYAGPLQFEGKDWEGDVVFSLTRRPDGFVSAGREPSFDDVISVFIDQEARWLDPPVLTPTGEVTFQPGPDRTSTGATYNQTIIGNSVGQGTVGDGTALDRVTFLIPNGFEALDGFTVCDGENVRSGALIIESDGWVIRIEPRTDVPRSELFAHIGDTENHTITHVGEVSRADGDIFDTSLLNEVLDVLRVSLSLFLGRITAPVLPVGWRDNEPVWSRWGNASGIVRPAQSMTWRDQASSCEQFSELLKCVAAARKDDLVWQTVRQATSYLLTASEGMDVLSKVTQPVPGLLVVAYTYLTQVLPKGDESRQSTGAFSDMGVAPQITAMCDAMGIASNVPPQLQELLKVRDDIVTRSGQNLAVSGIETIVKLRNQVMHPRRTEVGRYSTRQWAEAGLLAQELLQLSILRLLDYQKTFLPITGLHREAGASIAVPWAPATRTI